MSTRTIVDAVGGAAQIAVSVAGAPLLRRGYNSWGATSAEVAATMPGDELLPDPKIAYTRAVTVDVPPVALWPWLVQIGQGRGGMYSYDALENLVGCDLHSADAVLPDCQCLEVEGLVRMGPEGYPCFRAVQVEAPSTLVLVSADVHTQEAVTTPITAETGGAVWQWQLTAVDGGSRTRLVVRQRLTYPPLQSAVWHVTEPVNFVMERKMLLGLKARAEQAYSKDAALSRART